MDGRITRREVRIGARVAGVLAMQDPAILSGRGHDRVLRVARTIADLDGRARVGAADIDEALGYRPGGPLCLAA
jgi:magnesium chelatase family protein